jgi:hypothetical protein
LESKITTCETGEASVQGRRVEETMGTGGGGMVMIGDGVTDENSTEEVGCGGIDRLESTVHSTEVENTANNPPSVAPNSK